MRVAGPIGGVGIRVVCQGIEHALDVVLLDRGKECLVGCMIMGRRILRDWDDVGTVHIFSGNEAEALLTGCGLSDGLRARGKGGFPDHVGDSIANLKEGLDNIRCKRMSVKGQ